MYKLCNSDAYKMLHGYRARYPANVGSMMSATKPCVHCGEIDWMPPAAKTRGCIHVCRRCKAKENELFCSACTSYKSYTFFKNGRKVCEQILTSEAVLRCRLCNPCKERRALKKTTASPNERIPAIDFYDSLFVDGRGRDPSAQVTVPQTDMIDERIDPQAAYLPSTSPRGEMQCCYGKGEKETFHNTADDVQDTDSDSNQSHCILEDVAVQRGFLPSCP